MPPPVETGKSFTLAIGETASPSPSLVVKFVSVTEDSRCPKGEQCVWAGNARVVLEVSVSGGSPSSVTLDTNPSRGASEVEIADRFLVLEGLAPLPVTGRTIGASDYRVTLSVQPR